MPRYSLHILINTFIIIQGLSTIALSQDLDQVYRDYENGRFDRVRNSLDVLEARYFEDPEFLFMKAVFEEDAEQAYVIYQQISQTAPDNPVFEKVLWRMCQYNYAKGLYRTCYETLGRFISTFPQSENLLEAQQMQQRISGRLNDDSVQVETDPPEPQTVYTIQIAAFGSRAGAERGLAYYKRLGLNQAYIREHRVGRQILYKVWIGEYTDREEARSDAVELQRKYRLSAFTIIERNR